MMVLLDQASVEGLVAAVNGTMLVLAIAGTLATLGLLIWTLRSASSERARERPRRDRRKGSSSDRRDPREALALVGDALAATHNPRVLLPVILEVITESTGCERRPDLRVGPGGRLDRHCGRFRCADAVATARLHG